MSSKSEHERAQLERARQSWELVLSEVPGPEFLDAVRKILRVKRFEMPAFRSTLPGVVRRGAEVDLLPLQAELTALGVRSEIRKSAP